MDEIKGVKLKDLVDDASTELLQEMRRDGVERIKRLFGKSFVLTREINEDKNKLAQKEASLQKTLETIEKVKKGDWSALKKDN